MELPPREWHMGMLCRLMRWRAGLGEASLGVWSGIRRVTLRLESGSRYVNRRRPRAEWDPISVRRPSSSDLPREEQTADRRVYAAWCLESKRASHRVS